jgi:ectoine hydroxylase-related dioxygenase (phytanoyl-CoA dioxygenase family)
MAFELKHVDSAHDVRHHLQEDGVVVIDNVLDASQVSTLHTLLDEEIERDLALGVLFRDQEDCNERLLDIVCRHKAFRDLVEHPLSKAVASAWLKPRYRLSSFGANVTTPGSKTMFIHADQIYVPAPWPSYPLALNLIWALDDFTLERGATHFLPGSHKSDRGPDTTKFYPDTVPIICKAGSVVAMDARVWHHTGANTTADQRRAALLLYFVNWFILPQQDWAAMVSPELREELSPHLLELLGFREKASMHLFEQFEGA